MSNFHVPQIRDVAEAAGVSYTTASCVLRGDGDRFSLKTRNKVISVARNLGWYRNASSDGIKSGKSGMIGVLVAPYDSYWEGVLSGIHSGLTEFGYIPITLWEGSPENSYISSKKDRGLDNIKQLIERRVEGLILWPAVAATYYERFCELIDKKLPVVVIDHELSAVKIADSVETDEQSGARQVAEYLTGLGHRKILCLSQVDTSTNPWSKRRTSYFQFAVSKYEDVECVVEHINDLESSSEEVIADTLLKYRDFTAVFCVTDNLARLVYNSASKVGLGIPDDISVVGFAGLDFSEYLRPALTTVKQKSYEVGVCTAKVIVERAKGISTIDQPHTIQIGCELLVRNSTKRVH